MPPSWGNYYSHEIPNIRGWFPTRGFRSQCQSRCVVDFVKLGSDEAARNPEPHTVQPCGSKVGPAKEAPPNFSQLLNPNRVRNFSFSGICITASRRSQAFRAALSPQASREAVCRRTDHVIGQRGVLLCIPRFVSQWSSHNGVDSGIVSGAAGVPGRRGLCRRPHRHGRHGQDVRPEAEQCGLEVISARHALFYLDQTVGATQEASMSRPSSACGQLTHSSQSSSLW